MFSNPGIVYCFNITGVITLVMLLQLVVRASDGRGRKSFAVVTVKVAQDQKPPVFEGAPYKPEPVSENIANYSVVFTLHARDADLKVGAHTTVISALMSTAIVLKASQSFCFAHRQSFSFMSSRVLYK